MRLVIFLLLFLLINSHLCLAQATYTSIGTGNFNSTSSWTILSGTDSDGNGLPDSNDDVIVNNGHTITLTSSSSVKSLNNSGTFNFNSSFLYVFGNSITNTGAFNGPINGIYIYSTNCTISSTSLINFGTASSLSRVMDLVYGGTLTISSGTVISNVAVFQIRSGGTIMNNGSLTITKLKNLNGANNLNNLTGSSFTFSQSSVSAPSIEINSGSINISNSNNSTFNVNSSGSFNVPNITYYNLNLTGSGIKNVSAPLVVNNDLSITSGSLNLGANNLTVGRDLTNSTSITSSSTINIAGTLTFTGTGNLASNNTSTIVLNGSGAAQTITIPNAITVPFYNLTCSNASGGNISVTGTGKCTLKNTLVINSGTFNVGSNILTMLSDASSTAIIGNSAGSITGSMIIQRYMAPCVYRKYDLGSPVTSATIDDWDNELFMSIGATNDNSSPAYLGGEGSAGGTSSVFIYNNQLNSTKKYVAVSTGTNLVPGRGYQTLIADDLTGFPGRAIDTRGTPNMGSVSLPVFMTGTDGFNLVANPFQAEIDWLNVEKSNVSNTVYFLEYNGTKSTYLTARVNPKINPGLGFMCVATGANPSVTITQNSKTTNTSSAFGARFSSPDEKNFDIRLRISSPNTSEYNEADLYFDKKAEIGFDFKDFLFGESLIEDAPIVTFVDAGKQIVRNYFNDELESVSFPLLISTPIIGNYSIDLEGLYESNVYQDAYLVNNISKEKYSLRDNKSASIYFDKIKNDHFQLVLSKKSNTEDVINSSSNSISVFATSENLIIKNSSNNNQQFELKVYNLLGQMLMEQSNTISGKSELSIPIELLKSDIYVVKLKTNEGNEITKKVVLTK